MSPESDTEQLAAESATPEATVDHSSASSSLDGEVTATGSWEAQAPDQTADQVSGPDTSGLTADYPSGRAPADVGATVDAPGAPVDVGATVDAPSAASAASAAAHLATGHRHGGATGSPAAGAYPPVAPEMRSSRYLLKKFHAKGGMGEIWLAEDCEIGRPVALKKMFSSARPEQQERFLLEAQVTGQLEHPGIVPVHELGVDETGQPFYAMKFIQGQTLKAVIEEYHGTPKPGAAPREVQGLRLLQIFLDVCQAVAYAHSRGVIHRDLKPDNVMVGAYGETLLLDWGLAKPVGGPELPEVAEPVRFRTSGESVETQDGSVKGTPSYMSPEVAEGRVADVDQVSDIYLLGATLYQILTGKRPRQAKKVSELIHMAVNQRPTTPRKLDPKIAKPLEAICLKAMAHQKQDRYQTATALAEDVQRYLAGEPVTAYRENFWERAGRWIRRHRVALGRGAAALLVLGLALFGGVALYEAQERGERAERQASALRAQQQAREDAKAFQRLSDETRLYAAFQDPGGEHVPYYPPALARQKGQAALAVLRPYGAALAQLPLDELRDPLKRELYELLLLLAEVNGRGAERDLAPETLALLDRAAELHAPTPSCYLYRTRAYRLLGEVSKADAAQQQAEAGAALAVDHFLAGERDRTESVRQGRGEGQRASRESLKRAVAHYRQATEADRNHYWAHFQLGYCHLLLEQREQAVETFGTCVVLRPDALWAYNLRGLALGQQKRYQEALADVNRAIDLGPGIREPRLTRGLVHWLQGKEDDALKDFAAVLEPPPEQRLPEAAFYRGQLLLNRGAWEQARSDFDLMVARKPRINRSVYSLRARTHFALGDVPRGVADVNTYLAFDATFDPRSADGSARRGHELYMLVQHLPRPVAKAQYLLALAELQQGVKRGARSAELYEDLGTVLEKLGRVRPAIDAYSESLKLDGKNAKVATKLGWAHEKLAQYKDALSAFALATRLDRTHAEAYAGLGYIQACLGRGEGGTRHANLAVLHGAGDYLVLHNVACVYAKLSEKDEKRARILQDMALDLMRREVELWRRDRTGPNPIVLLRGELPAFPEALRQRPELAELLKADR